MRIFVTGISGFLGLNAALQLKTRHEVSGSYCLHPVRIEGVNTFQLELSETATLPDKVLDFRPDVVLHAAGLTSVDECEHNPKQAERLNVRVSENVARIAQSAGAFLVHISTDHLSDGTHSFVNEAEKPVPLNVYARTKWQAEQAITGIAPNALIVRTNFFGWSTPFKPSFSDWILEGLRMGKELPLFEDVHITPLLVNDLIGLLERMLPYESGGIYNIAGSERVSKYEFAVRLAGAYKYSAHMLRPVRLAERALSARRPLDMSLNTDKVVMRLGSALPSLDASLERLKTLEERSWPQQIRKATLKLEGKRGDDFANSRI